MAGSQNVLIVEDDGLIAELYRTTLVRDAYHVEIAHDSNAAFELIKSFKPDVIFLDIMLPGMSGIDILKILRTKPEYGCMDKKILLLTNLAQKDMAATAVEYDADGYIIKADVLPTDLNHIIKSLDE